MSFNPDSTKQAQEINFPRSLKKTTHHLVLNNSNVSEANFQKPLGVTLDFELTFTSILTMHYIRQTNYNDSRFCCILSTKVIYMLVKKLA